jgi:hypothetical protein
MSSPDFQLLKSEVCPKKGRKKFDFKRKPMIDRKVEIV